MSAEKVKKYVKYLIFILLLTNLIGVYFMFTGQFGAGDHNQDSAKSGHILDILINIPRSLGWLAIVLLGVGWILWEFAIAKSGKKIYAYISIVLFVVQAFVTFELLSFIGVGVGAILMIVFSHFFIAKTNNVTAGEVARDNVEKNGKSAKKLLSFGKDK